MFYDVSRSAVLRCALAIIAAGICSARSERLAAQNRASPPYEVTVQAGVPYTGGFELDVFVPRGQGPFPTAVTLHGASGGKAAMEPIARPLSELGWIVYNVNWLASKRPVDADVLKASIDAAACALRFVAKTTHDYGGDGEALTVVGLSAGGLAGALVSLASSEFGQSCEGLGRVPTVDLFVGLEGAYLNAANGSGGLAAAIREQPELAVRLDPRSYIDGEAKLSIVLFLGDEYRPAVSGAETFYEALRDAGIKAELRHTNGPHLAATFTEDVLELLQEPTE